MNDIKHAACLAIDHASTELYDISQEIWKRPETGSEEHNAHDVLTRFLESKGFNVERKFKLDTAFRAFLGSKENGPHIAVMCEYDALPVIGHACGHNLIAESAIAAGLGVKAAFEKAGKPLGCITVLGTPSEETTGGKIDLINQGCFTDVDAAMMVHPAPGDSLNPQLLACASVIVKYSGKASHAAAFPWEGVNALDAAVTCYQTISNLRQQMKPTWRVHGVILNGGVKSNIIPEETELEYSIRTQNKTDLEILTKKCVDCFESAARATGCKVEIRFAGEPYLNVISNLPLLKAFESNCKIINAGDYSKTGSFLDSASTDMGNVSYVVPSIHPCFYIGSDAVNHTREFTVASGDHKAQPYTIAQSKAMAMTAIDVFMNPGLLEEIKTKFKEDLFHN
ncbi:hypothetical protein FSP39_021577 [Pinctada imbricata]|uniref:Peptidase M20 domain-containing protein 2 n=1 Tax=Pinctada imbricata TaxID=66713 RepID=A0AA88XTV1_PINIB|nr:hypothetical protein FSP39_021577 [Pinctada imbricata]